ncbi:zinc finger and BTB domain-containing protein 18-like isoform X2 [Sipha flava]|uniref:Longitudinals lacking protein, isoforms H/M/V n=1 Tax=Sipha flava TaxID=143950 RepID=A0A2S2QYD2_9HEMI|nr:zinc finger and BTB domain-containing protein 18-like isoform X2 [Sipha flava]
MDHQQQQQQQFCLRWNNHQNTLISVFDSLLESGSLVDCALAAEGQYMNAHKVVLSACSPYFAMLLNQHFDKYPVLILKDVTYQELRSMMDYMYRGEVNITQEQLGSFLKAAESLQIKGLSESSGRSDRKLDTRKNSTRNISPGLPKKSVTPKVSDGAFDPSMTVPPLPPQTIVPTIPNTKRRKLVQPVKNFSSLVVSPVNPSRTNANNLDVNNTPNPTAPSLAGEGKANIPSPPIIPKPVVESASVKSEEETPDVNGVLIEDKEDNKFWPSSGSINEIKLEKTDTEEDASESDNNAHSDVCTTSTTVSTITTSQINMTNFRPEEGMELTEYGGMNIPPNMQDQGSLWWKNFEQNSKYVRTTQANPFSCQHCGKRYRWKSTLKRHEVFECGGKEPVHRCPHCEYRAKQSGNLRVHIRKYHTALE